jgi:hypothetical protein
VQFTVSEQNYATVGNGGGFTAATSGVCSAPVLASETMSGTTYIAMYTASSSSNGSCNFQAVDVYGQSAVAGTSVIQQQLVCNTDADAGQTIGTIQYVGTTAVPPCAPPPTPTPQCPTGYTGTYPDCTLNQQNPTPSPGGCVVSGSAPNWVFTMPATGGTCTISGTATLTGSSTACNPFTFTCRADIVAQTGTDTQGVGAFTLNYDDSATSSVNTYGGWYCFSSGALAGEAGCQGVTVDFATLPNASLPLTVNYAFSNWTHSGTCANIGINAFVLTAELEAEAKATAQTGTNQQQPYYASYHSALLAQGYEPTYYGIDPTANSFFVTWLPESSQLGTTCTASESLNYTVTVTQAASPGGVTVSGPAGLTIQQ